MSKMMTIGLHRGSKRIWIEGKQLSSAGFTPFALFDVHLFENKKGVQLILSEDGKYRVSGRNKNNPDKPTIPVIDLKCEVISDTFEAGQKVSMSLKHGSISIN